MVLEYTTGYAGTGKSTELIELSKKLPTNSVILCPTHKAIQRLRNDICETIEIKTIHSLLGWIPTINEEATHVSHIDSTAKLDKDLEAYTDIVIDEGGMMSEEMLTEITSKLESQNNFETDHITIHIFLDPYQLQPVKGKQIMIDPLTTKNLTTQHRAESPDVVALFTKFVNFLEGTNTKDLLVGESENVTTVHEFSKFKVGDRVLAFTNKAVGYYNKVIAKELGIESFKDQDVQLGNKLDLVRFESYITPSLEDLVQAYNEGTLKLQNAQINKKFVEPSLNALIQHSAIQFMTDGHYIYPVIPYIDEAYRIRNEAKVKAVENKAMFKWVYALGRAWTMDYSFASTVHKAQGSEFSRVWIDKADMQKSIMNGYYGTYARLMYVSISRAKKQVFIINY